MTKTQPNCLKKEEKGSERPFMNSFQNMEGRNYAT